MGSYINSNTNSNYYSGSSPSSSSFSTDSASNLSLISSIYQSVLNSPSSSSGDNDIFKTDQDLEALPYDFQANQQPDNDQTDQTLNQGGPLQIEIPNQPISFTTSHENGEDVTTLHGDDVENVQHTDNSLVAPNLFEEYDQEPEFPESDGPLQIEIPNQPISFTTSHENGEDVTTLHGDDVENVQHTDNSLVAPNLFEEYDQEPEFPESDGPLQIEIPNQPISFTTSHENGEDVTTLHGDDVENVQHTDNSLVAPNLFEEYDQEPEFPEFNDINQGGTLQDVWNYNNDLIPDFQPPPNSDGETKR